MWLHTGNLGTTQPVINVRERSIYFWKCFESYGYKTWRAQCLDCRCRCETKNSWWGPVLCPISCVQSHIIYKTVRHHDGLCCVYYYRSLNLTASWCVVSANVWRWALGLVRTNPQQQATTLSSSPCVLLLPCLCPTIQSLYTCRASWRRKGSLVPLSTPAQLQVSDGRFLSCSLTHVWKSTCLYVIPLWGFLSD